MDLALERKRRRYAVLAAVFFSLAFPSSAKAAFPGANGKIAYTLVDEIWVTEPDGSGQALLATPPRSPNTFYSNSNPAWSPNGSKIAFQQDRFAAGTQGTDVFVANADGSGQTSITNAAQLGEVNADPSWSPNGSKIAVAFGAICPRLDSMNSNGSGRLQLTTAGCDTQPSWSPDGSKIAFTSTRDTPGCTNDCNHEIYVMNADGSAQSRLTSWPQSDSHPSWSPDGTKIAFTRREYNLALHRSERYVWTMNPNGSAPTKVGSIVDSQAPAWSPDRTRIAFDTAQSNAPTRIWVMNAAGTGETAIADGGSQPDWQPIAIDYEHPASATPIHVSIVPAFRQCGTGANPASGGHSPPLATAACLPPNASSNVARAGPGNVGSADLAVITGDVQLNVSITDVRATTGADYNPNPPGADMTLGERLRITDRANAGGASGTATEVDFGTPVDCASTLGPEGSNCSTATTANAVMPGVIQPGKSTVIQVFRLRIEDAGANGVPGDSDDRLFAQQGIYIP